MARHAVLLAVLALGWGFAPHSRPTGQQGTDVRALVASLSSIEAVERGRAACALKRAAEDGADAIPALVVLLPDASPLDRSICQERWSRHAQTETSPGELAAAALVAIGSRSVDPLIGALRQPSWIARRHAVWALGALGAPRAAPSLRDALRDREPAVRGQAAWALGAIGDASALEALVLALRDDSAAVREQAAWALGAIGDSRATPGLIAALKDTAPGVRRQAAWAIGAIGR